MCVENVTLCVLAYIFIWYTHTHTHSEWLTLDGNVEKKIEKLSIFQFMCVYTYVYIHIISDNK